MTREEAITELNTFKIGAKSEKRTDVVNGIVCLIKKEQKMTELERALLHIKTRADAWAVKEVEKALSQEQTDIEQKTQEYEKAFMDGFESCSDLFTRNKEQQPCDDVVSRQAVMKIAKCISKKAMPKYIDKLPSVTQKSGKWIITPFSVTGRHYQCSECKYIHTFTNFEYCPNCGAKMVEPQESEET